MIDIIILNWNRSDLTIQCLESLKKSQNRSFRVILIDNNSKFEDYRLLEIYLTKFETFPVNLIRLDKNYGFAGGHAMAYQYIQSEYFVLLNNDTFIDPGWLDQLKDYLDQDPGVAAVGGRAYIWKDNNKSQDKYYSYAVLDRFGYAHTQLYGDKPGYVDTISGAGVMIRKSALEDVGYLAKEFFLYYEETDLFLRLRNRGWKIAYQPKAKLWHQIGASSTEGSYSHVYYMHRNRFLVVMRNYDSKYISGFLLEYYKRFIHGLLGYLHNKKDLDAKARLRAGIWNSLHLPRTLVQRYRLTNMRSDIGSVENNLLPAVAVVILNYNYQEYLDEAIRSVLNQSYKPDRIILVDDHSSDSSLDIARKYKHQIEIITKSKNLGVIDSKNYALSILDTYYVVFLDADDKLDSRYLEETIQLARKKDYDIVYTGMQYFGSKTGTMEAKKYRKRRFVMGNYVNNSSLIKLEVLRKVGGYKQVMEKGYEDWEFFLSCAEKGAKFGSLNQPLLLYRQHKGFKGRNIHAADNAEELFKIVKRLHQSYFQIYGPIVSLERFLWIRLRRYSNIPIIFRYLVANFNIKFYYRVLSKKVNTLSSLVISLKVRTILLRIKQNRSKLVVLAYQSKYGLGYNEVMNLESSLVYQPNELNFGTSGLRGLVSDMTDLECYINTVGFIDYLKSNYPDIRTVAIAGDLRDSTPRILEAIIQAILDQDLEYDYCGLIPTPALAYYSITQAIPSIMVTGSHIPDDRNGIKYYKPDGEVLKDDEVEIKQVVSEVRSEVYDSAVPIFDHLGRLKSRPKLPNPNQEARDTYRRRYLDFFDSQALEGKQIVFYQHSAVGRELIPEILTSLGAEVIRVGFSDKFIPVDSENIDSDKQKFYHQIADQYPDAFAIVSTDGDSDRPLVFDQDGNFVMGDILGLAVASELGARLAVFPISSNSALVEYCIKNNISYLSTKIGSPYVIKSLEDSQDQGVKAGWEVNGGFILGSDVTGDNCRLKALLTRDAVLPIIISLVAGINGGKSVSQYFKRFTTSFTQVGLIDNFPVASSQAIIDLLSSNSEDSRRVIEKVFSRENGFGKCQAIDLTDGVRISFDSGDKAHIRPSGNAPQLRIYSNASSQERADQIVKLGISEPNGLLRQLEKAIEIDSNF